MLQINRKKCTTVKVSRQMRCKEWIMVYLVNFLQQIWTNDLKRLQIWNTEWLIATFKTVCGRGTFCSYISALHIQTLKFSPFVYALICIKTRLTGILFLTVLKNTCKSFISKLWNLKIALSLKKYHTSLYWYLS